MSYSKLPKFHLALLSTAVLLAYSQVQAADEVADSAEADTELEAITVVGSAGKIGGIKFHDTRSADVIKRSNMDENAIHKIDEAIANQAGVLTNMYGTDNKVDWFKIRGFDASTAIDGTPTTPNGFFVWLPEAYGVESVEVIKGANSNLYGASGAGGVVNLVSKRPKAEPAGEVKIGLGTDKRGSIAADYSGVLTEDNSVRYRVVAQARREDSQIEFANMKHYYFAPSLTWDISDNTNLTLLASYQHEKGRPTNGFLPAYGTINDTPYGKINRDTSMGEPDFDKTDRTQVSAGYEFQHDFGNGWKFSQNYRYSHMDLLNQGVFAWGSDGKRTAYRGYSYSDGDQNLHNIDNRVNKLWQGERFSNTLLLGLDYLHSTTDGKNNGFGYVPGLDMFNPQYGADITLTGDPYHIKLKQTGLYAQNQFKWDNWLLNAGVRHDKAKSSGYIGTVDQSYDVNHTSYNAGLMYQFDIGLSPYVNYSESFRPISGGDAQNRAYKPYEGRQLEVGLKYSPVNLDGRFSIAYFDLQEKNALVSDASNVQVQAGERRGRGVELQADVNLNDNWSLAGAYTYTDSKQDLSTHTTIRSPMMPRHMASTQVAYKFNTGALNGLKLGTSLRYVGSTTDDQYYAGHTIPSYTLWDAMAQYTFAKDWQVQLNARNLTDKDYVSACSFYCYYGAGRSVEASLSYKW